MKKLFPVLFLFTFTLSAQTPNEQDEFINGLDTTSFDGRIFLNKGGLIKEVFNPFIERDTLNKFVNLPSSAFKYIYECIDRSKFEDSTKTKGDSKKIKEFYKKSKLDQQRNSVLPIGILISDAILLDSTQIRENQKAKKEGKAVSKEKYKTIQLYAASLLQDFAFQNNLSFLLSKDLVEGKQSSIIKGLAIDFQDGKGWQEYKIKDAIIHHKFEGTGEFAIGLKLITKNGDFISYCKLNIISEEQPYSDSHDSITSPKEIIDTGQTNNRIQASVAGASYWIYTGCDGVFDKPIIIAEGFDLVNSTGELALYIKYYESLVDFRNAGYDLVFVSYDDATDYIENNAQALKKQLQKKRKESLYQIF